MAQKRQIVLWLVIIVMITYVMHLFFTSEKNMIAHVHDGVQTVVQFVKNGPANNTTTTLKNGKIYLANTTHGLKPWQALALLEWDVAHPATNGMTCKNLTKFGNYVVCMDEPYKVKPPCLVYSFGINYDFSFDDAMARIGCEVHSFDPSMLKVNDHQRNKTTFFYRLGLTGSDENVFVPRKDQYIKKNQTWEVRKLNTIKKKLGHTNRKIDVLKIDIESYEWDALENFYAENILDDITHFIFEWHLFFNRPKKSEVPRMYQLYEYLSVIGFRSYYKKRTYGTSKADLSAFYAQGDTCWANTKLKKKKKE